MSRRVGNSESSSVSFLMLGGSVIRVVRVPFGPIGTSYKSPIEKAMRYDGIGKSILKVKVFH